LESLASLCGCLNYCGRTADASLVLLPSYPARRSAFCTPHPPRSGSAFGLTQTLSGARMSVQR
jgi:hypothetical protein